MVGTNAKTHVGFAVGCKEISMKTLSVRSLMLPGLMFAGLVGLGAACVPAATVGGSGGKVGTSTGGATTTTSSGGATTTTGSGGTTTGTGGAPTTTSSGGATATTGSGGATTTTGTGGGSAPTDGGASEATFAYTFDTSAQGFGFNTYVSTTTTNLAAPDSGSTATAVFDSTAGEPTPGSLKVTASFTDYKQFIDVVVSPMPPLALAGKTIHAKIRLNSGTFPKGMGATLHAGTTANYVYGGGAYTELTAGAWTDLSLDLNTVTTAMWDPSMVVQIGIQIYSGDPGDGGAFAGPVDVSLQIDSITDGTGDIKPPGVAYNFDTATQGWDYNHYVATDTMNLAAPDASTMPTLTFDSAEGSPSPGSLKSSVTFSAYKQFVDVVIGPSPALNLMGKTLHAKVKLTSGTFADGAGVTLHAGTTTSYVYGAGAYTTLMPGIWTDLTLDLASVTTAMWDPTMVVQIGLQFYSGDPPEAGSFVGPNDVVFNIDSITAE
jgi:hypothetical protein